MVLHRYFAPLSSHVVLKFLPHTAARCCNKQQQETPRAQQYTSLLIPCAHGKLNVKHHRTTPKPETHITSKRKKLRWRENRKYSTKTYTTAQPPPPAITTTDYRPYDSKQQHNYWVELVRVCRLAVVAAAAACCSCCYDEDPTTLTRHGLLEGRCFADFLPRWQAGWYFIRTCMYLLAAWVELFY